MLRIGIALLLSLFLVSSVVARPSASDSVWPLTFNGRNICTASSINVEKKYWLTAAHCVDVPETVVTVVMTRHGEQHTFVQTLSPGILGIMGEEITVVMRDVINDLAIVQTTRATAPALKLADRAPEVEDAVKVVGYPFGFPFQVTTLGSVAALEGKLDPSAPQPFALFQITAAPGNSGSAILNARGEVISVLQVGWGRSFGPMVGGVVFKTLETYRSYFA